MEIQGSVPAPSGAFMTRRLTPSIIGTVGGVRRGHTRTASSSSLQMQNTFSSANPPSNSLTHTAVSVNPRRAQSSNSGNRCDQSSKANLTAAGGTASSFPASLRKPNQSSSSTSVVAASNRSAVSYNYSSCTVSRGGGVSGGGGGGGLDQHGLAQSFLKLQKHLVAMGFNDWSIIREADVYGGVLFPFACFLRHLLTDGAPDVTLSLMAAYDWFLIEEQDESLVKSLYKVLFERFGYRPSITVAQFCAGSPLSAVKAKRGGGGQGSLSLSSSSHHAASKIAIVRDVIALFLKAKEALDRDAERLHHLNYLEEKKRMEAEGATLAIADHSYHHHSHNALNNTNNTRLFLTDVRREVDRNQLGQALIDRHHHSRSLALNGEDDDHLESEKENTTAELLYGKKKSAHVDPSALTGITISKVYAAGDEKAGEDVSRSRCETQNPLVLNALRALRKGSNASARHHAPPSSSHSLVKKRDDQNSQRRLLPWQEDRDRFGQRTGQSMVLQDSSVNYIDHNAASAFVVGSSSAVLVARHFGSNDDAALASSSSPCCRHLRHALARENALNNKATNAGGDRTETIAQEKTRLAMLHKALNRVGREPLPQQ